MMEGGWSARRVDRQLGCSDCVVRRGWDQWIRDMSYTRTPGLERPQQTSCQDDRHIIRNTHTANCFIGRHPGTGSIFTRGLVSFQTIQKRLAERHFGSW
ncbi:HTH_Tnp_Tc3_2 domain-containing protein [Trichonephila clavipes]|nr:HTH_Tnp_Tc3_2 domain-containing protein [Trichonephila clavipes]